MTDEIDHKLARLNERIQSRRDQARAALAAHGHLEIAEALRAAFGATLQWHKGPGIELGSTVAKSGIDLGAPGCLWTHYEKPRVGREHYDQRPQTVDQISGRGLRGLPKGRKAKQPNASAPPKPRWKGGTGAERSSGDDSLV